MPRPTFGGRQRAFQPLLAFAALACTLHSAPSAESQSRKAFDVPAGLAATALKQFVSQSGVQLLYVVEEISDVRTNAVLGEFTAGEAIQRLLANTGLAASETRGGAIAVNRAPPPKGQRVARELGSDHPMR